jgi:hypothetical protein
MKIDEIIKAVFEREVNGNRSIISPFQNYSPGGLGSYALGEKTIIKNRRSRLMEIGFAACFIVILGISVFLKDDVFRSPIVNQGTSIARLFPEDPKETLYDFISAIHSSF